MFTDRQYSCGLSTRCLDLWVKLRYQSLERHLHMFLACHSPVAIYLHAGVLEWKGKALVLPGISYSG